LQSLLDEKNMDLQIEIPEELPAMFQDQAKIQQILTNLLSNAIKFTPDGGLIAVRAGLASEDHFFITVSDTGVGIPESDFEIIFEKFRQSSAVVQQDGLTRQFSGTGLGLSITKELCRLLGGEIRLTSQLGTGSIFQVILPIHYLPAGSGGVTIADAPEESSMATPSR
jgi:signal transduction histidine kinase